jgi:hypothetical protein
MTKSISTTLALAALILTACGLSEADVQGTVAAAEVAAVQTVHAQYTEIALLTPSPTNTLPPSNTPTISPTSGTPTTAPVGGGGAATGGCDVMTFLSDVTIQDGEQITAGTAFTKTWQVRNDGTCEWATTYTVIYSSGDQMSGLSGQTLTAPVAVGSSVNLSVQLTAPSTAGDYTGWWAIANASGQAFGFFSVVIEVP